MNILPRDRLSPQVRFSGFPIAGPALDFNQLDTVPRT